MSGDIDTDKVPEEWQEEPFTDDEMPACSSFMGHMLSPISEYTDERQTHMVCSNCGERRLLQPGDIDRYTDDWEYPEWCK